MRLTEYLKDVLIDAGYTLGDCALLIVEHLFYVGYRTVCLAKGHKPVPFLREPMCARCTVMLHDARSEAIVAAQLIEMERAAAVEPC